MIKFKEWLREETKAADIAKSDETPVKCEKHDKVDCPDCTEK